MTISELYRSLNYVDATREKRSKMAVLVLNDQNLVAPLLEIAFYADDPISSRACWVLEFVLKEKLDYLLPYLEKFTTSIAHLHLDSSVRPMAKICEFLLKAYFSRTINEVQKMLTEQHLERITTACFDWLIGKQKVAVKAYSMTCLQLLGQKFNWIHPELKMVLEQNYADGSAAYKARARMTLAKIK